MRFLWILPPVNKKNSGVYQYSNMLIDNLDKSIEIKVMNLPDGAFRYLFQFLIMPLKMLFISNNYSKVIFYDESLLFLTLFCKSNNVVIIHDYREIKTNTIREYLKSIYMKFNYCFLRYANKIITVSNYTKNELEINRGVVVSGVVYNCIECNVNSNPSILSNNILSNIISKKIVLNVGSHESRKNIKKIVDVVDSLGEGYHLIQAGRAIDISAFNDNYSYAISKCINFSFLQEIDSETLDYLYSKSNVYLNLSSFEGFGRTPVEAQAFSLPVLSTTVGGLSEALDKGFIPIMLNESPLAIANKIKVLNESDEYKESLMNEGLSNVQRFSCSSICNQFLKVLDVQYININS